MPAKDKVLIIIPFLFTESCVFFITTDLLYGTLISFLNYLGYFFTPCSLCSTCVECQNALCLWYKCFLLLNKKNIRFLRSLCFCFTTGFSLLLLGSIQLSKRAPKTPTYCIYGAFWVCLLLSYCRVQN